MSERYVIVADDNDVILAVGKGAGIFSAHGDAKKMLGRPVPAHFFVECDKELYDAASYDLQHSSHGYVAWTLLSTGIASTGIGWTS